MLLVSDPRSSQQLSPTIHLSISCFIIVITNSGVNISKANSHSASRFSQNHAWLLAGELMTIKYQARLFFLNMYHPLFQATQCRILRQTLVVVSNIAASESCSKSPWPSSSTPYHPFSYFESSQLLRKHFDPQNFLVISFFTELSIQKHPPNIKLKTHS